MAAILDTMWGLYEIERDGDDFSLFQRTSPEGRLRYIPISRDAAIRIGVELLKQAAPDLLSPVVPGFIERVL